MPTPQVPIGSGFNSASTAGEVIKGIDLAGKTAIVTGGYSGLGRETARELRAAGARVIVPARDPERATAALAGIDVEIESMDLLDPVAIDALAERYLTSGQPLHFLVNSAGIMANPLTRDTRGYESQFATNHLGHFQLTVRLWPALTKANGARVVSVSSWDIIFPRSCSMISISSVGIINGQSKTDNILFAVALDECGKKDGVRGFSLHPGSIPGTGLQKYLSVEEQRAAGVIDEQGKPIHDPSKNIKTVEQGAATSVWCAISPQLDGMGGVYCENGDIAVLGEEGAPLNLEDSSKLFGVLRYAIDPEAADRLWTLSKQLLGLKTRSGLTDAFRD
jgi:NAD(P)-dependent dehydrogenase (short-subunit alcohol dehydrogenase family)